ncbi:MAG: type IV secretion system DNA-binding domain-containing protein [Candidatus Liptonbacteria bacterium]
MGVDPDRDVIYFGKTDFREKQRLFGIKRKDRRQHVYIIGKTGTGKSVMEHNMIVQDIINGEGVCVVDPHGELVEGIMHLIPVERKKDVIYFNPADSEFNIGFNILDLPDPKYKHLVASGLMGIFTKIWAGVWSARMEYILSNAILALLDNPGTTLLGVNRILVDKDYRQQIIAKVDDPVVKAFWTNEFEQWKDQFRNEAIAPIQNKVGQFLSTGLIRNIIGQPKSTLDVFKAMNEGKILLVNVSKGRIGEDNSALLGAMMITKIQLAAMERVRIPEDERVDFYLYVDEFQNFATDAFAGILSEARKYRLNLIVAHQYIGQLMTDTSTAVRDAIFGNVGTMIAFRVGGADAEFLEKEFEPEFVIQDLVNIPNYHIYLRLMVDGITSRPFSAATLPPFKPKHGSNAQEVIDESRARYARPRAIVEEEIKIWSSSMAQSMLSATDEDSTGAFEGVCSVCGKKIRLPFEPTPGRPVYCKADLLKIKSGEIQPPSRQKFPSGQQQKEAAPDRYAALAGLGIEFEPEKPKKEKSGEEHLKDKEAEAKNSEQNDKSKVSAHPPREIKPEEPPKTIALSELVPQDKKPKHRAEKKEEVVDVAELRQAIATSLAQAVQDEKD